MLQRKKDLGRGWEDGFPVEMQGKWREKNETWIMGCRLHRSPMFGIRKATPERFGKPRNVGQFDSWSFQTGKRGISRLRLRPRWSRVIDSGWSVLLVYADCWRSMGNERIYGIHIVCEGFLHHFTLNVHFLAFSADTCSQHWKSL